MSAAAGRLDGPSEALAALDAEGIASVGDVIERAEAVRDLPDRSNHVLSVGARRIFVKRTKSIRGRNLRDGLPREAHALRRCEQAGVPTARLAFQGHDPTLGAVTGTFDLAPARPLDDLLREGRLDDRQRRHVLRALARATASLHNAGLHHRDLYLNHVYVDPDRSDTCALIDLERLARHRRALGRWVVKDLGALASSIPEGTVSDSEQTRFLIRYLRAHKLPRRGVVPGLVRRVQRKVRRVKRHVPRTPVGDAARPGGVS